MRLIKLIKAAYRLSKLDPGKQAPEWTKEEAQLLSNFLSSPLGQKIKGVIFRWIVQQSFASIDRGADKAQYNVGYAMGFRDGIAALDTLVSNGLLMESDDSEDI